jgi:hypothetical protein
MNNVTRFNNEARLVLECQFDLNSSAAVIATRGTGFTVTKTATGLYTAVFSGVQALKLVEVLSNKASYCNTVPATALGVYVRSVAQANNDVNSPITITVATSALPTSGADIDGTAATTVSVEAVVRCASMLAWT